MRLTDEQRAAIERRSGSLLLSANAGSGKTTVLAERFARSVVEDGIAPGRLLAITFTEKAAGELRGRVRARLEALGRRDAAREMDSAWISTIHGFCARILRAHAVSAGLDPRFTVLDDAAGRAVRARAWDAALAAFLGGEDRAPLELTANNGPDALRETIEGAHDELRSHGHAIPRLPPAQPRVGLDAAVAELAAAHGAFARELSAVVRSVKSLDDARGVVLRIGELLEATSEDPAEREVRASELAALKLGARVAELQTPGADRLRQAIASLGEALADARAVGEWELLDRLLDEYATRYAQAKRARSALDYDDLELELCALLDADPALAAGYAERFERIMVDEFQDTNPLQLRIVAALDRDDVFAVGDELQSIYGFRHADVSVFRERRARHAERGEALTLATNWRSRPELLQTINALFSGAHDHYVPLVPGRDDAPDPEGPRTELLVVDRSAWDAEELDPVLAESVSAGMPAGKTSRHAEARAIAHRVRELVDDGATPGDVAILLRAATDMQIFERALELEGLPTLASGGRGFWGRQQVQDLTAYLAVLANPRDAMALMGALASPLCGLSSDGLARVALAARGRDLSPWELLERGEPQLGPADDAKLRRFVTLVARERPGAGRRALDALIARAVRETGYDLHVLRLAGGRRRLANVHKLERLAAEFEAVGGRDLRGFIDHARAELDADAREPDAPIDPGDRSAVALMTIHAAKGLEFGIVVVADLGRQRSAQAPRVLVDGDRVGLRIARAGEPNLDALEFRALKNELTAREMAEERRILHVAVTRAEERLILTTTERLDRDEPRWTRTSNIAPPISYLGPLVDPALPGRLATEAEVGYDELRDGHRLRLRALRVAPADARERIGIDAGPGQLSMTLDGGAPRDRVAAEQSEPPLAVVSAVEPPTALSYSQLAAYDRCGYRHYLERVLRLPRIDDDGPLVVSGERIEGLDPRVRGSLLHVLLEELDLAAPGLPADDRLDELAAGMESELTAEDRDDLRRLVATFVDSPLRARLTAARAIHREDRFTFPLGAMLVNGAVDVRAIEDDGTALVVDYKTDRLRADTPLEALVEHDYGAQRRIYALAELRAGAPRAEIVHLFLERPDEPAVARYDATERERLERELLERAGGLLRGEFPVAAEPHVQLCRGCPGRGTLCVHPRALTEREVPEPAGSTAAG